MPLSPPYYPYVPNGNITAAVVAILNASSHVAALSPPPVKISTDMRGYNQGDSWIVVARAGGSQKWPQFPHSRVDITAYGALDSQASDTIEVCKAVMFQMQGNYTGNGLVYLSCEVETDSFRSIETDTNFPRYILSLRIVHKSTAAQTFTT